jgi:hypothetical protein
MINFPHNLKIRCEVVVSMKRLALIAGLLIALCFPSIGALAFWHSIQQVGVSSGGGSLLLDTLSVSPTVAYSTRKLRAAYAGSAMRVQRSSDSTQLDTVGLLGKIRTSFQTQWGTP